MASDKNKVYERLKEVRASKTVELKPCKLLRDEIIGLDGQPQPFKLRYYQVQGVFHMLALKRMILGDGTGLGKTVETIAAQCYLWDGPEPKNKVIIVAPKSAMRQWAGEVERFTVGVKAIVVGADQRKGESPVDARERSYREWLASDRAVLIINYALLIRDWNHGGFQPPKKSGKPSQEPVKPGLLDGITKDASSNLVAVFDEATAFKSMRTKTWEIVRFLADRSHRAYGLTATLLKNNLKEGFAIYKAIKPDVFSTQNKFFDDFCHVKLQTVARNRKIPIVVGYKNLDKFRATIDPYFLGRAKHHVSDELPALNTRDIRFELNAAENAKYTEALNGLLELGNGELRDFEENKTLVSLIYCQQVVDSLSLLQFDDNTDVATGWLEEPQTTGSMGSKESAFIDLLTEELDEEKVIVFTRFEKLVGRLTTLLEKKGIKSVRITGKENDKKRREAQQAFQDLKSDVRVCFITAAGSEAINLQAAAALVFFDMPWSWGDYVQILGRMIRIGSPHKGVFAIHLIAERPGKGKTIDHHVLSMLLKKKKVIDMVLGEAAVGALEFDKSEAPTKELLRMMMQDV